MKHGLNHVFCEVLSASEVVQKQLQELVEMHDLRPRAETADWGRHTYRELNTEADSLANKHCNEHLLSNMSSAFSCYRLFFDGSVNQNGAGGGCILYGAAGGHADEPHDWTVIASCSFEMPPDANVTVCKLEACVFAVVFMRALTQGVKEAHKCLETRQPLRINNVRILKLAHMSE